MFDLTGKVGIVTGAASGIGQAIRFACHEMGGLVAGVDLPGAIAELSLLYPGDVSKPGAIHDTLVEMRKLSELTGVDFLVNCAGVSGNREIEYMDEEEWRRVMSANLDSAAYCSQAFVREVLQWSPQRGDQCIVNVASMTGMIGNGPGFHNAHYAASKAGMIGLTKAMAIELAPYHIRVNAVAPGPVLTPMLEAFRQRDPKLYQKFIGRCPLGVGHPEDVAQAVVYLLCAQWVTGTVLVVDGGYTAQ